MAFVFTPKMDRSAPWSMVPKSMKPLLPAIASIRALASSARSASGRSAWNTAGSNLPSCRSKSFVTSPNCFSVCSRTWVVVKVEVIMVPFSERGCYLVVKSDCVRLRFFAVLPQFHAGTRCPCYQLAGLDFDVSQLRPRLHDPRLGGQGRPPNGPEEDYQSNHSA